MRVLIVASIVCLLVVPAQAKYGGGTGAPYDPYQIRTAQQMNEIGLYREDWDKHFRLLVDIDLRGYQGASFNIIASRDGRAGFTGVFDGNGHTISNFSYICHDSAWLGPVGLFGVVCCGEARIHNLGLIDPTIEIHTERELTVGLLVGELSISGAVSNCYVEGATITGSHITAGGLVGYNTGTVADCHSSGTVAGKDGVGGIVGINTGTLTDCYSTATVDGNDWVGGVVGTAQEATTITGCHSAGTVGGHSLVGGLAGFSEGPVTDCNSTSTVTGTDYFTGGLLGGVIESGTVEDCYSNGVVVGKNVVGGLVGGAADKAAI